MAIKIYHPTMEGYEVSVFCILHYAANIHFLCTLANDDAVAASYCPTVLILKPNQTLHIGMGRSHAFRKLTLDPLPDEDCHKELREVVVRELKLSQPDIQVAPICYSIAYDWYV